MGENVFEKFNEMFNVSEIANAVKEAAENSGDFEKKEVPFDDYECRITKLEIGEHTFDDDFKGMPEAHVWFKIINHPEYSGQTLFMNKRLVSLTNPKANGFIIHNFNTFLESLESGITPVFENFEQYKNLVDQIFNEIDGRAEYQLHYYEANNKGRTFKDYVIIKRF